MQKDIQKWLRFVSDLEKNAQKLHLSHIFGGTNFVFSFSSSFELQTNQTNP